MSWSLHYLDKQRVRIADASGKLVSDAMAWGLGLDIVVEHNTGPRAKWGVWFPDGPRRDPCIHGPTHNIGLPMAGAQAHAIVAAHNSEIERDTRKADIAIKLADAAQIVHRAARG